MKLVQNEKYLYVLFEGEMDRPILRVDKKSKELKWVNESEDEVWEDLDKCELVK